MITNQQAQEAAQAFVDHFFGNETARTVRVGIPARAEYDDDLVLSRYLDQCEKLEARFDDVFVAARQAECAIERTLKTGLFLGVLVEQDLRAALDAVRAAQADDESVDDEPQPTPADRSLLAAANKALVDRVRELEAEVEGRVAWCRECGSVSSCDEDGCCSVCGCDLIICADVGSVEALERLVADVHDNAVDILKGDAAHERSMRMDAAKLAGDDVSPFTLEAAERRGAARAEAKFNRIHEALVAAYERVWWMAERYAEDGGSGGPECRDLNEAREEIDKLKKEWQET